MPKSSSPRVHFTSPQSSFTSPELLSALHRFKSFSYDLNLIFSHLSSTSIHFKSASSPFPTSTSSTYKKPKRSKPSARSTAWRIQDQSTEAPSVQPVNSSPSASSKPADPSAVLKHLIFNTIQPDYYDYDDSSVEGVHVTLAVSNKSKTDEESEGASEMEEDSIEQIGVHGSDDGVDGFEREGERLKDEQGLQDDEEAMEDVEEELKDEEESEEEDRSEEFEEGVEEVEDVRELVGGIENGYYQSDYGPTETNSYCRDWISETYQASQSRSHCPWTLCVERMRRNRSERNRSNYAPSNINTY